MLKLRNKRSDLPSIRNKLHILCFAFQFIHGFEIIIINERRKEELVKSFNKENNEIKPFSDKSRILACSFYEMSIKFIFKRTPS